MELHRKVEKVPSVLSDGTSLEEKANQIVDRNGGGDTGICSSSTKGRGARFAYGISCVSVIWFLSLAELRPGEGGSHIKMKGVLVVIFRVQNLEIDTLIIVVPLKV